MTIGTEAIVRPDTAAAQDFWRNHAPEWDGYWRSTALPHRTAIIQACHYIPYFTSLLELGSGAGTNFRLLRDAFPWARLTGLELNPSAVAYAKEKFRHDPQSTFYEGSLMGSWPVETADLVVLCYSGAYIGPADILGILQRALAAARLGVLIAEPHCDGMASVQVPGVHFPEWYHPYVHLMQHLVAGRPHKSMVRQLLPPVDRLNVVSLWMLLPKGA